ncbi:hypothetical protein D3C76_721840 [compost metagenome]
MPVGKLGPGVFRQVDQRRTRARSAAAFEVETVITDHHHLRRLDLPLSGQAQQAVAAGFRLRLATTEDVVGDEAIAQADGLQGQQRQFVGIAGQDAEAAVSLVQRPHQFHRAGSGSGKQCQLTLVRQQPGMLGRRLILRQCRQVAEDVLFLRDAQGALDRRKVVHGQGQGAVHVEHPVADVTEPHSQSLRWRIRPSWVVDATSWPARL